MGAGLLAKLVTSQGRYQDHMRSAMEGLAILINKISKTFQKGRESKGTL